MKTRTTKRAKVVNVFKSAEVNYRKSLVNLIKLLNSEIVTILKPTLINLQSDYVKDSYASTLESVLTRLKIHFDSVASQATIISNEFVNASNKANKRRFYAAMNEAVGVDLKTLVSNENLEDVLIATTKENVSLIKTIPEQYFNKIETIVFHGTTQGNKALSMLQQIQKQGKVSVKRAKLIARDQSSKLNSALNQHRQRNVGVEKYVWRTAGDSRVRDDHSNKNGKIFRWDSPPSDTGHPGSDIQCRCIAQPILNF